MDHFTIKDAETTHPMQRPIRINPASGDIAYSLSFGGPDSNLLFRIMCDGTIERGPGFTTEDEMSLKFWEYIERARRPLINKQHSYRS